jgi:hypothetical protein
VLGPFADFIKTLDRQERSMVLLALVDGLSDARWRAIDAHGNAGNFTHAGALEHERGLYERAVVALVEGDWK